MIDETGNRYGSLTVLKESDSGYRKDGYKKERAWLCVCDCGRINPKPITGYALRSGRRTKCRDCSYDDKRVPEFLQKLRIKSRRSKKRKEPEYLLKIKERGIVLNYKKYGLTEESFLQLFYEQDQKCAICKCEFKNKTSLKPSLSDGRRNKSRKPHIDHCHKSGNVRGLLCTNCNTGLGQFKDDPQILQSAIEYLT